MRALPVAVALSALVGFAAPAAAVSVTFTDFASTAGLQLNGTAATTNTVNDGDVLRLTSATSNQSGSAFSLTQISASNFSTYFEYRITNRGGLGGGADGIAFVIQTVSNTAGGAGGGIGYAGLSPSVAVEFDTFDNGGGDGNNSNHLGIDTNGNMNSIARTNIGTDFDDGNKWYAWVDYDGTTLEVRTNQTGIRAASADLSAAIDIQAILGQSSAFIGFTSGTGAGWGNHDIIAWQYRDSFSPGNILPEPGILGILGLGLIALGLSRRRRTA